MLDSGQSPLPRKKNANSQGQALSRGPWLRDPREQAQHSVPGPSAVLWALLHKVLTPEPGPCPWPGPAGPPNSFAGPGDEAAHSQRHRSTRPPGKGESRPEGHGQTSRIPATQISTSLPVNSSWQAGAGAGLVPCADCQLHRKAGDKKVGGRREKFL